MRDRQTEREELQRQSDRQTETEAGGQKDRQRELALRTTFTACFEIIWFTDQ